MFNKEWFRKMGKRFEINRQISVLSRGIPVLGPDHQKEVSVYLQKLLIEKGKL